MNDSKIKEVLKARGPLGASIREAVAPLVRAWEKENGARVSGIDINMLGVGIGPERWFEFTYVDVNLLLPDGTEITQRAITQRIESEV